MLDNILSLLPIILAVVVVLAIILTGYVKAPPDQAYIISGLKKESKVLIGRAGIRVPFFERMDRLYLGQMTVDIKTEQSVPTSDFINVNVDAVAKVRISPHAEGIKLAAKNFLNKRPEEITRDLQDSLQGNMREIIGTLSLKEINTDRDSFSDQVMQKARQAGHRNPLLQHPKRHRRKRAHQRPGRGQYEPHQEKRRHRQGPGGPGHRHRPGGGGTGVQRGPGSGGHPDRPEADGAGHQAGGAENPGGRQKGRGGRRL